MKTRKIKMDNNSLFGESPILKGGCIRQIFSIFFVMVAIAMLSMSVSAISYPWVSAGGGAGVWSTDGENISYVDGRQVDINNDNSTNDWLSVEDDGSEIFLKPSGMNMYGGDEAEQHFLTGAEGGEYFWRRVIRPLE